MSDDSTQRYIDGEKNWISTFTGKDPIVDKKITGQVSVIEEIDIDADIEKQITQLQEAKLKVAETEIDLLTNISKKQAIEEVSVQNELTDFFSTISSEKKELKNKVKKEEVKIAEVEKLFKALNEPKKEKKVKKKKQLLVEPEKIEKIEEPVVENVVEKTPEELTIIDKVSKQLSDMKVAKQLDENKLKSLESVDTLDKLKREFLNFKDRVAQQMQFTGGGLDTNKISANLMPTTGSTFDLGSADRPWRKLFLSGGTLIVGDAEISGTEIAQLDGVTAGTITASKAVIVDSSKDITGFRNITLTGELDAATLDISGNADIDGTLETDALSINGTAVTSTAAELNILDGKSFVDEDNMASNSATAIASQQSIKAYVDGQISGVSTAPFLFTADDEGSGSINLTNEDRLTIRGGTGVSTVTTSGTIVTINVDNTILTTTTGSTKGFAIAQAVALG
tara:strand:+ start:74 stop:1432 length:1359 start_codon:yes stop_codon:yes gene_type:complete